MEVRVPKVQKILILVARERISPNIFLFKKVKTAHFYMFRVVMGKMAPEPAQTDSRQFRSWLRSWLRSNGSGASSALTTPKLAPH